MKAIDRAKAKVTTGKFQFLPLRPKHDQPLASLHLPGDTELLVLERGGEHRGLIAREMAYHHICQGELEGQPFLVSF